MAEKANQAALDTVKAHVARQVAAANQQGVTPAATPTAEQGVTEVPPASTEQATAPDPVPYDRFKEVNDSKNDLQKQLEATRQEMESLKAQTERELGIDAVLKQSRPEGYDDWSDDQRAAWIAQEVQSRSGLSDQERSDLLKITVENKIARSSNRALSNEQLDAAVSVALEHGGTLTPDESIALAAFRNPALFEAPKDGQGSVPRPSVPASHATMTPSSAAPKPAPTKAEAAAQQRQAIGEADTIRGRMRAMQAWVKGNLPLPNQGR